jgi:phage shock protein B
MDGIVVAFFVPTIIFLCFVAPVWIFMHYRSKQKTQNTLSDAERFELESLSSQADRMMERIETLEAILDSETPGWRKRVGAEYGHE